MTPPSFLIVGAAKCGTTSLYEYLRRHPEVFMPARKEPHFFLTDPSHRHKATEAEYWTLFADVGDARAVGEASTNYLYDAGTPDRILETLGPGTRIVISLRNPVDMAYALWGDMVRAGGEKLPFPEALDAWRAREHDPRFRREHIGWLYNYSYVDRARYAAQVERYLKRFEHVRVYLFEEFFASPERWFPDLCRFLGVSDDFVPEFRRHNRTGPVRSTRLRDALNNARAWKGPLKAVTPTWSRRWLKEALNRLNNRQDASLPPLPDDLRARVWGLFEADVEALERLLGRSVHDRWLAPQGAPANVGSAGPRG